MNSITGVSTMVLIMVLSFALERIVKAILFLLSFVRAWARRFPDPLMITDPIRRAKAERKKTLAHFVFAGILALIFIATWGQIRLFIALGIKDPNALLDILVTTIALVGGSDLTSKIVPLLGKGDSVESSNQPITITGRLILDNSSSTELEEQSG